jgi:response regulator RpfG family c-di-GMP phosphodiesterase
MPFEEVLEEFESLKGQQFDPDVVDALGRFIKRNHVTDEG